MLVMVEKGIRRGIRHSVYRYAKVNKKYMKDYDKNKESSYLSLNNFEWIEDTSQLNKDFVKAYNKENDEGYFLEVNVQYLEKLHELHNDLLFYQKE